MNKFFLTTALLFVFTLAATAQAIGHVVKKTKEFSVPANLKENYRVFGYEFPNNKARKIICFSSYRADVTIIITNACWDLTTIREE